MENQSRQQDILFYNMPKNRQSKTWDDCERAVREVIKDKLKIGADIQMDRAHSVGSLIIIRLQNGKDKDLILKNAHNLKQDTNIGISEDFRARNVREKRKGLLGMLRSYQQDKIKASLVFGKLLTPNGVLTFDTESGQVKQIGGPRTGYTRVANSKQQHVDSEMRADSQRDPSDRGLRKKRAARAARGEESVWELNCLSGDQLPSLHDNFDPVPRTGHLHNLRPRSRDPGETFSAGSEDGTSWGQDARPAARGLNYESGLKR